MRIFSLAESDESVLGITRALNAEGVASPMGKQWSKTVVHKILNNEASTGTLVWGVAAIQTLDYRVVQAVVLFKASIFIVSNLVVDILYTYLDPRIRYN